ncbi:hypothetical protein NW762_005510 [Fusarium torreyae]|uniref:Uncharacterized protein n=1 Tax=Fusarium torreyae TaxID=1237075 RepID=A0A9W8S1U9_9HYPO|nr:hypothetical protein NW762_005510 [Fusarium torreyae]
MYEKLDGNQLRILNGYTDMHEILTFANKYIELINVIYPWLLPAVEIDAANRELTELEDKIEVLLRADEDPKELLASMGRNQVLVTQLEARIAEGMRKSSSFEHFSELLKKFVREALGPMGTLRGWLNDGNSSMSSDPTSTRPPTSETAMAGQKRPASDCAPEPRASKRRKRAPGAQATKHPITIEELSSKFSKNSVSEWPTKSGKWWILRCEEHEKDFKNPRGASTHLVTAGHKLQGEATFAIAVQTLGIQVLGCTSDIARTHNSRLDDTRKARNHEPSRVNPRRNPAATNFLAELNPNNPRHRPAPRQRRTPEVDPTTIKPEDIYVAWWNKKKKLIPIMVLPFGPWPRSGYNHDAPTEIGMLGKKYKLPKCYMPRRPGQALSWAPGYRDGEDKVEEREYPCVWFNEWRFPSHLRMSFIKAKNFRHYDRDNKSTLYRHRVDDFIPRRDIVTPPAEVRRLRRLGELTPHSSDDESDDESDEEEEEMEEDAAPENPIDEDPGLALMTGALRSISREFTVDRQSQASILDNEQDEDSSDDGRSEYSNDDDDDDPASAPPNSGLDSPMAPNNGGSAVAIEEEDDLYEDQGAGHPTRYDEVPQHSNNAANGLQRHGDFILRFSQPSRGSVGPFGEVQHRMAPPPAPSNESGYRGISRSQSRDMSSNRDTPTRPEDSVRFDYVPPFRSYNNQGSRQTSREQSTVGDVFREVASFRQRSISSGA